MNAYLKLFMNKIEFIEMQKQWQIIIETIFVIK